MPNKISWEENNRRYAEAMEALEAKGAEKCYFPCNDCRGLQTRIILITSDKKHCKEKGHAEGGYEYHPLVRRYSLHIVLVIILIVYSQFFLSF